MFPKFIVFVAVSVIKVVPAISIDYTHCAYERCPELDENRINVHIIPHSHNDVGWLKTLDQYYYGSGKEIHFAGVQYIITSVVESLKTNPKRRFVQAETVFFWKWWKLQTEKTKRDYISLVNNGQIEIVNGAWAINDEATTYYQSIVDQFTWGLRKVNETLGKCGRPKIGWQIDSFGHSREHASILKQLGFEALVLDRIDYRDKARRRKDKDLNFLWQSDPTLDDSAIFTTIFPDHYSSISGLNFDVIASDPPVIDDPSSPDYNLGDKINILLSHLDEYSHYYKTKNIMVPYGGDFNFQAADINFLNMDKIINVLDSHEDYNIFYSLPSCFIKAVKDEILKNNIALSVKTDDFFPYATDSHSYWTGYYTSRPTLKRFERIGNNILQAAKQLATFSKVNKVDVEETLIPLREIMGVLQHHNAITGTEKQAVAKDYIKLLNKAIQDAINPMGITIGKLLKNDSTQPDLNLHFSICLLSNISVCETTKNDRFLVAVYNPLARLVDHYIRLPVEDTSYIITGPDGLELDDVLESLHSFNYVRNLVPSQKELLFLARAVPPLGIKLYHVEKSPPKLTKMSVPYIEDVTFGNEKNGFIIDPLTKLLKSIKINGYNLDVSQEFWYYDSFVGNNQNVEGGVNRSSGSYAFRPANSQPRRMAMAPITIKTKRGSLVDEVKQVISEEITQIIRVYKHLNDSYIEFDWLVGNLQSNAGKEIVTRFTVKNFSNKGVFYTDSNGRQLIKREIDKRNDYEYDPTVEPIASNYYPVTSRIVMKDEAQQLEVSIVTDRSQGGTSPAEGVLELMIHRRILNDDGLGVGEALNEIEFERGLYVRGQHWLSFGSSSNFGESGRSTTNRRKDFALRKILSPLVFVANATKENLDLENLLSNLQFKFQGLLKPLPDNIHLLTLEPWKDEGVLLRLEHMFEKDEDVSLSKYTIIDLDVGLFPTFDIRDIEETNLGANEWLEESEAEDKLLWINNDTSASQGIFKNTITSVSLNPMQIRTFVVKILPKCESIVPDNEDSDDGGAHSLMIQPILLLLTVLLMIYTLHQSHNK